MAMSIKGDFGRLEDLIARVRTVASAKFREAVLLNIAEAARTEIVLGFERGQDPYGRSWDRLKARTGRRVGGQPLRDRGQLQNSFNVRPNATGFTVSAVYYAAFHQHGTRRMVARPMVPTGSEIGPIWRRSFVRVLERQLGLAMRG